MRLNLKEKTIQRLIEKAFTAHANAESKWAKYFWYNTWKKLCNRYKKGIH